MRLRKTVMQIEEVHVEGGCDVAPPMRTVVAAAVIENPWMGEGFVQDLEPEIVRVAPLLAETLVPLVDGAMGGADGIEAFGKAAVVGLDGEIEHASALIHTLRFGNRFREMAKGESFLSFANIRGVAGCLMLVPLVHKNDRSQRSHFLTATIQVPDAPAPNEVLVALGAASSGRPFARIGNRHRDMEIGAM